ncbi:chemotaxis protein CheW [Alicyclobacillus acidiphilus]|uniref:chemotaxis protein CheW n=1 Tax=Alicyclobacillus acidiphilus TaxID=182455 RepID=UPI0008332595|nr:chemotaxis protein CheW [Alicyclobacillus acidiphilus]
MSEQYVVMKLGNEFYGASVMQVISIERMMNISQVPRTLSYIKGVVNLRGTVTPVIDLRERVGLTRNGQESDATRIVVTEVNDMTVGMIVDAVEDVVSIEDGGIAPPPPVVGGIHAVYLKGVAQVGDRLLVILNLEKILSDVELEQLQEVDRQVRG